MTVLHRVPHARPEQAKAVVDGLGVQLGLAHTRFDALDVGRRDLVEAELGQHGEPVVAQKAAVAEMELTGLAPGERVFYQAAACGFETAVLDFYAAPEPGSPLRLTVWGDSQSNPPQATATVDAMMDRRPLLDLHVGDTVGDGSADEQWGAQLFEPLRPLGHHVPTYVAIGNHEGNDPRFFEVVSYPLSVPGEPGAESTYAFAYGNAFFLVVDTNQLFHDVDLGGGEVLETPLSSFIKSAIGSDAARHARQRLAPPHRVPGAGPRSALPLR